MDFIKDERADCYSLILQGKIKEYLEFIEKVYEHNRGGIEGQRDVLKTGTAVRIRKRMVDDLKKGAVLPPIVLGVVISDEQFDTLEKFDTLDSFCNLFNNRFESISIIDGMQRTAALFEASEEADLSNREMRIEFWIARNTNSLIYRMLILNTGQTPWNLRRQIEVVFRTMIKELTEKIPQIELLEVNDQRRRTRPGQFQADQVIEMFLAFGSRKEKIDVKERLADEFIKLDFIEITGDSQVTYIFYEVVNILTQFDTVFGNYPGEKGNDERRFRSGRDIFGSQPARVGFSAAIGLHIFGRPGIPLSDEKQQEKWAEVKENSQNLLNHLNTMNSDAIGAFLDFDTLNEAINKKSGKVGDFEREFFLAAFKVLIEENFRLDSMTSCWRAY